MDITTITTTAAPRTRGESSFMVPSGMAAWHLAVSPRFGNAFGVATGTAYDLATRAASAKVPSTDTSPIVARDGRTNAKQAGPPRRVPR